MGISRGHHENPRWDPHNVICDLADLFEPCQGPSALSSNICLKGLLFLSNISWQEMVTPALATIIVEYRHKIESFRSVDHIHLEPPPIYSTGEVRCQGLRGRPLKEKPECLI